MKILVTGHQGYIGVYLVELLKEKGYYVTGVDLGLFKGCNISRIVKPDREIIKDYRDLEFKELENHDCIIHLAAISNDPMGEIDQKLTYEVNYIGSVDLAKKAKVVGIPRFLFSSSCSIYGSGQKTDLDESSELNPLTAYAKSKVLSENEIKGLADKNFCPVFLRNATAYGFSPMLRLDLVANNFLSSALVYKEIRIMSDGKPWRPLIHVYDIAKAFIKILEAPLDIIHNKSINIGSNEENFQVKDIANTVKRLIPNASIIYTNEIGVDPRSYKVNFSLFKSLFGEFKFDYNLEKGLTVLKERLIKKNFDEREFNSKKYIRISTLKEKIHLLRR